VSTRSPSPARPPMVSGWPPLATARRVISPNPVHGVQGGECSGLKDGTV
jgi:hypothetical protein